MSDRVFAQVAVAGNGDAAAPGLEEIIVTAQRRSENQQSVPIAISTVTAAGLARAGVARSDDLATLVPGLTISRQTDAATPFLRGVGASNTGSGAEGSVALYVDDVYIAAPRATIFSLNNIDRIEVLKGPQGTLFGRNATGGLVHIITRTPKHELSGQFSAGYANYDTFSGSAYVTGGLSDAVAMDLAVQGNDQRHGWGRNLTTGADVNLSKDISARSKMLVDLGDATHILLSGDYAVNKGDVGLERQVIPGFTFADPAVPGGLPFRGTIYDVQGNFASGSKTQQWGGSAKLDQDLGFGTLTSITAYRNVRIRYTYDQDGTPLNLVSITSHERQRTLSQEVRLASASDSKIKWVVGAYYYHSTANQDPTALVGSAFAAVGGEQDWFATQKMRSMAAFGQASIPLFDDHTRLTLGGRYTVDRRTLTGIFTNANGTIAKGPVDRNAKWNRPTFRASIDHDLGRDFLVYASYNRGYKSGEFDSRNITNPVVNPEKLDAFEIGQKAEFLDHRLRINTSAFYYDYKNIQLVTILGGVSTTLNAAAATIKGVEGQVDFMPTSRLTLSGSISYLDGKYDDFPAAPTSAPNPAGGNLVPPGIPSINARGRTTVRTPKWTSNLTANYSVPVGDGKVDLSLSYYYNDGFPWDPDGKLRQGSYNIVNTQVNWTLPGNTWKIGVWARNLANEKYYVYANSTSNLGNNGAAAAPRTYGATVGVQF